MEEWQVQEILIQLEFAVLDTATRTVLRPMPFLVARSIPVAGQVQLPIKQVDPSSGQIRLEAVIKDLVGDPVLVLAPPEEGDPLSYVLYRVGTLLPFGFDSDKSLAKLHVDVKLHYTLRSAKTDQLVVDTASYPINSQKEKVVDRLPDALGCIFLLTRDAKDVTIYRLYWYSNSALPSLNKEQECADEGCRPFPASLSKQLDCAALGC